MESEAACTQFEELVSESPISVSGNLKGVGLSTNMFRDATVMIRDYIAEHGDEFGEIVYFPEFQKYFEVQGTSLKNVPCYETV